MKKFISLLLALVLCLSLCACGGGNKTPETTEAPVQEIELTLDNYTNYITIDKQLSSSGVSSERKNVYGLAVEVFKGEASCELSFMRNADVSFKDVKIEGYWKINAGMTVTTWDFVSNGYSGDGSRDMEGEGTRYKDFSVSIPYDGSTTTISENLELDYTKQQTEIFYVQDISFFSYCITSISGTVIEN